MPVCPEGLFWCLVVVWIVCGVVDIVWKCCLDSMWMESGCWCQHGSNQLLAGGWAGGLSLQRHPGSKAGLKFNDASCQLHQAVSANELALAADWATAAAPGNVAHVSEGRGSTGAAEGPAGDPGRHREARISLKSAPISIFHYALLTDKAQPDVLFSAI